MQINYKPLQSAITKKNFRDARSRYNDKNHWDTLYNTDVELTGDIRLFVLIFICCIVLFTFANVSIGYYFSAVDRPIFITFVFLSILAVLLLTINWIYKKMIIKNIHDSIKLERFANANGMKFIKYCDDPLHKGMIFSIGTNQIAYNQLISGDKSRSFEIGNYQCTEGSYKNKYANRYGYIVIRLDRNLPHIVLDSKANNIKLLGASLSNLPEKFDKNQVISLEGDFDSYFTLYAPKEYEHDALYIFTPDLMALFIDKSDLYDAEVIDNQLYIY